MASPSSITMSQSTPPPTFTPTNGSKKVIHSTASSPNHHLQINREDIGSDEESTTSNLKRSHDTMNNNNNNNSSIMDIDYSSPIRPTKVPRSPSNIGTPRADDDRKSSVQRELRESTMKNSNTDEKDTPSKDANRRNYNTSFSGAKIKHLKKADGEPLWRKDIQFDWLYAIFTDEQKVFTNSYDGKDGQTFADIYIDAMARSSKTSKVLRDKLMQDRPQAINMAMVCLLVNIGRMNTTLNFFPEMRAQLRTYHAIPALQTYVDPNAYKQLQDAPRLKSILKGACEDRKEPTTLDGLVKVELSPRTNPINLVFLLANSSTKVTDLHFGQPRDFFDLVMRVTLSSKSRCRAFLWLMWWYLESKFTAEDSANNPFGAGQGAETVRTAPPVGNSQDVPAAETSRRNSIVSESEGTKEEKEMNWRGKPDEVDNTPTYVDEKFKGLSIIVPALESLSEEQAALENIDPQDEITFGNEMKEERMKKMAELEAGIIPAKASSTKKPKRPSKYDIEPGSNFVSPAPSIYGRFPARGGKYKHDEESHMSDSDARSMSPERSSFSKRNLALSKSINAVQRGLSSKSRKSGGSDLPVSKINLKLGKEMLAELKPGEKRARPLTQHQIAVIEHRRARTQREIDKMVEKSYRNTKRERYRNGPIKTCWNRIKDLVDPFAKSDDEFDEDGIHIFVDIFEEGNEINGNLRKKKKHKYNNGTDFKGPAGLVGLSDEEDDFGEENTAYSAALRRANRRLLRWEEETRAARRRRAKGIEDPQPVDKSKDKEVIMDDRDPMDEREDSTEDEGDEEDIDDEDDEEVFQDAREHNDDDQDATEEDEEDDADEMDVEDDD